MKLEVDFIKQFENEEKELQSIERHHLPKKNGTNYT